MRPIITLVRKDLTLFLKDKPGMLLTFFVPLILIYIIGNIFGGAGKGGGDGLSSQIKIAAFNESGDASVDAFIKALENEDSLNVLTSPNASEEPEVRFTRESLKDGIANHSFNYALIIPQNYRKENGIGIQLEYLSNPKNQIEAQIVNGLIQKSVFTQLPTLLAAQVDDYQRMQLGDEKYTSYLDGLATLLSNSYEDMEYDDVRKNVEFSGLSELFSNENSVEESSESLVQNLINIKEEQVFGKEVKNPNLTRTVGGYAIMFLLFATTSSAASLFAERNDGIFHRILSMPVKPTHILWSKFIFNTLLGVVQALALFVASSLLFDVDVFSNFLILCVVSLFASSACTAFGMLIASVSKTPQQAQGLGTLLIISMSAIGGAWFPVSLMPETMQIVSKFTIVYWGVESYLGTLWENASILTMLPKLGVLAFITIALTSFSSWRFRTGDLFR